MILEQDSYTNAFYLKSYVEKVTARTIVLYLDDSFLDINWMAACMHIICEKEVWM